MELGQIFEEFGPLFIQSIKDTLVEKQYPYAPGRFGNAYSKGRNSKFGGNGPINATGTLLSSVSGEYDPAQEAYYIYMASYWRYVNDGREPGEKYTKSMKRKDGTSWEKTLYKKMLPPGVLDGWISKRFGLSGKDLKSASFAINYNIAKYGIRPTNFYDDAGIKIEDIIAERFPDEADDIIETFYDNLIKKIKK